MAGTADGADVPDAAGVDVAGGELEIVGEVSAGGSDGEQPARRRANTTAGAAPRRLVGT